MTRRGRSEATARAKARAQGMPRGVTLARVEGRCQVCPRPVAPGDPIARDLIGHGWVHLDCADASQLGGTMDGRRYARRVARRQAAAEPTPGVCPRCRMTTPTGTGVCDCA